MHDFWLKLAVFLGKRAVWVGIGVLVITGIFVLGLRNLDFATGQDSYLNEDEEIFVDNQAYQDLFGGQAMVTLFTAEDGANVADFFTEANLAQLDEIEATLRDSGQVEAVVSPRTALEFTQALVTSDSGDVTQSVAGQILLGARERDPDTASAEIRLIDALTTLTRVNAAGEQSFENPEWVRFLLYDNTGFEVGADGSVTPPPDEELSIRKSLRPFFPDSTHAQMVVRLPGNASIEEEGAASDLIVETMEGREWENFSSITTGAAVLLKDINDYLRGGMLRLGGAAVLVMIVVLLVAFHVRWRLLSLLVVLFGVVWAFGAFGFLGIPLSLVTVAGLPILIGVGIDFAIQMHSRVEEEVVLDRARHPIADTLEFLSPALITATIAAVIAFLALQLSRVPMIRDFGVLLAIGVFVIGMASIILPAAALGFREYRSPTPPSDYTHGALGRFVVWLGSLPQSLVIPLIVGSVAIFVGGVLVEGEIELQTDPEEWVNQDSAVIEDLDVLREETGSSSELGVFVESDDVYTDEVVQFVDGFAREQLDANPELLLTASSIVTTVSFLMEIPDTTLLPVLGEDVQAAWDVAPRDIQVSTASDDATALNLIFRTGPASLQERAVVVNEMRASLDPPEGVEATPSGLAVVGVGLLENLEANRALLTYAALGAVFLFLLLRFRSLAKAIFALVPVLIAVGAAALVAWAGGFELSPLTAVGGPLVIALCTEFTTLILMRYIEERDRGEAPREAIDVAAARTGRAFVTSALTAVGGVAVIALSTMPLLRDFGIIVALNVAVALLSALVILPPLLVWADEKGWVHRTARDLVGHEQLAEETAQVPVGGGD
jgi:hydrophobe/amphiphile efflux-3 (HAE3) family protein